jgi:hypothetical protein
MKLFRYPPFLRFFYRYGNIPVTLLLILYAVPLIINVDKKPVYILPLLIVLLVIYFLNKRYLELYNILPYRIEADEEKLITGDYLFSAKQVIIYFKDITELQGGVFEGKTRGVMKILDGRNNNVTAFYSNIINAADLERVILQKVPREVYEWTLEKIKLKRKLNSGDPKS